ncbi:MAG: proprotein convertase P-domain-containing protein, partial [Actinomycetota bacterium]|nr:proprotein convertase P-domain-containing protein [Actinomycetota bacterium]
MTRHLAALLLVAAAALAVTAAPASATGNFENPAQITINAAGKANPYPSTIDVTGQYGVISEVTVGLRGLSHTQPNDLDVLLVSPSNTAVVLMSDACGTSDVTNANWTFNQRFGSPMAGNGPCQGILHRPTDHPAGDNWPDAPDVPVRADLDALVGEGANGAWRLFVWDDAAKDAGKLLRGWTLGIETRNPVAMVPGNSTVGTASPYPVTKTVAGREGVIEDVDITIGGLFHERPADLDIVIESPGGRRVMLMSDACGESPKARDLRLTWGNPTVAGMPATGPCPTDFKWFPTDYGSVAETLPAPAPPRPYEIYVDEFLYADPNGEWKLYVFDDTADAARGFFDHFDVEIKTRPRATVELLPTQLELPEGETRELRLFRQSGGRGFGDGSVVVTTTPLGATSGTDYEPVQKTVELPRATQEVTVPIRALADDLPEDVETFAVSLSQPTGDAQLSAQPATIVSIADRTPRPVEDAGDPAGPGPGPGTGAG